MMKSKKLVTALLTTIMAVGLLTGCGGASNSNESASNSDTTVSSGEAESVVEAETTPEAAKESVTEAEDSSNENGEILVVYYSATGNTKEVAEKIANIVDGDLFEIEPIEPYTDDDLNWTNDNSRVSREHGDESLRDVELVTTTVDNWDSYDTVYIGYPIWWGIAAWPVDNFVKDNDFTGKTVIPFCTASSSEIGDSGKLLENMTGTGDWRDGVRFHGGTSESDIRSWIDSLGL